MTYEQGKMEGLKNGTKKGRKEAMQDFFADIQCMRQGEKGEYVKWSDIELLFSKVADGLY